MSGLRKLSLAVALVAIFCLASGASAAEYKKMTIRAATANPLGKLYEARGRDNVVLDLTKDEDE